MSKGKKLKFHSSSKLTLCVIRRGGIKAVGAAELNDGDKQSTLTGETISYYKAEREYLSIRIKEQKLKIKQIKDFTTYLLPPRIKADFLQPRINKWITREEKILQDLIARKQEVESDLTKYVEGRKAFTRQLNKLRAGREEIGEDTETQN